MTVSIRQVRYLRELSGACCEYCLVPQDDSSQKLEVDHIIPLKHGGDDSIDNLCLSCIRCNRYKGPNVAALDPLTEEASKLYNPRSQDWHAHFIVDANGIIAGLTPEGRATVFVLRMNVEERIAQRRGLILLERYPCEKP